MLDRITGQLDDLVAAIAPRYALQRAAARERLRSYDGASTGRRFGEWRPTGASADTAARTTAAMLRERARDVVRNDAHGARILTALTTSVVGHGLKAKLTRNGKPHAGLQKRWDAWASSTACDADGRLDLAGIQALAMRSMAESGDVLLRIRHRRPSTGLEPVQVQALEVDYLSSDHDTIGRPDKGHRVEDGIEYDRRDNVVAYHLHAEHPGSSQPAARKIIRVKLASMVHVYRADRPGQRRGVSWFAPILAPLRMYSDVMDAALETARVGSAYSLIIEDKSADYDPVVAAKTQQFALPEEVEPGTILKLPPGLSASSPTPPAFQNYDSIARATLQAIGAGLGGIPYAVLTGDYSQSNYSSSRMAHLEWARTVDQWRRGILIPAMDRIFGAWLDMQEILDGVTYDVRAEWTAPAATLVDPQKELAAQREMVRSGFCSLPDAIRALGRDPSAVFAEIEHANGELDARKLVLDSDPRLMSGAGQLQSVNASSPADVIGEVEDLEEEGAEDGQEA